MKEKIIAWSVLLIMGTGFGFITWYGETHPEKCIKTKQVDYLKVICNNTTSLVSVDPSTLYCQQDRLVLKQYTVEECLEWK